MKNLLILALVPTVFASPQFFPRLRGGFLQRMRNRQNNNNDANVNTGPGGFPVADFCLQSGQDVADGTQNRNGACSSTPQGSIPSTNNMVSTLILQPQDGDTVPSNTPFDITIRTRNMELGTFDDPNSLYYQSPQQLNEEGLIIGHQHVVIERVPTDGNPTNPNDFEFFKGLDTPPDANNDLSTTVDEGLPSGRYRLCSITGTRGHQPVVMPVAQRGSQDDCIRFNVVDNNQGFQQNANRAQNRNIRRNK